MLLLFTYCAHYATMSQKKQPYSRADHEIQDLAVWDQIGYKSPICTCRGFFEKLTDVNFVYFMYPITILQYLN